MISAQFNKLVRELFIPILEPHGFSMEASRRSTIYRQISDEVYHFILPDRFGDGEGYDIRVFPSSPLFGGERAFRMHFPDGVGEPTGGKHLNAQHGVGGGQMSFDCTSAESMRADFERRVKPALLKFAVPYLDRLQTVEDILPLLVNELSRGFALFHSGNEEGREMILAECDRLGLRRKTEDPEVAAIVEYIDQLLSQ